MKTFIFGASGFAKEVEWLNSEINLVVENKTEITYFVTVDDDLQVGEYLNAVPIISETEYFEVYNKSDTHNCIIALGNPILREKVYNKIKNDFTQFPSLIHPSVLYDRRKNLVKFGRGNIICAGCILTTNIKVGDFVHLNLDTTVGHDSIIGDFVTISPSVNVSGKVQMGNKVFVGTGANILEALEICDSVIIGAGSVVVKSLLETGTYVGVPSRKIK